MFGADLLHLDSFLNKLWINKLVLTSPHIIAYKTTAETATKTSKKKKIYLAKQRLYTCMTLFCQFPCRPCTNTTWNDQILNPRKESERYCIDFLSSAISWLLKNELERT